MCIAGAALRVADPLLTFGTAVDITLLILLGTYVNMIAFSVFETQGYKILLSAHFKNQSSPEFHAHVRRFQVQQVAVALSFAFNIIVCIVALCLDHSLGPMANGEWILLIVRGACIVLWQTNMAISSYLSYRNLNIPLALFAPQSRSGDTLERTTSNAAQAAVDFLRSTARGNIVKSVASMVVCALLTV